MSLTLADVGVRHPGGAGVHGLDLTVAPGEIVALIGLNGAGKTTLMRLALGMLRPASGVVRILGRPLGELPRAEWAHVGQLVEVPSAYPELTTRENLQIAARLRGAAPATAEEALDEWHLGALAGRRFGRLSLGNRQRVGLAAALQHHPRLIVLDEPSNALDPAAVLLLRDALTRRARAGGRRTRQQPPSRRGRPDRPPHHDHERRAAHRKPRPGGRRPGTGVLRPRSGRRRNPNPHEKGAL